MREPLWWVIQVAANQWGLPYPSINVLTSAIFFLGVHALAKRQPDPLGFLILLFPILIINMPMSGIRQAAAIGFLCLSFCHFIDRRPLFFALWIIIGGMIHSSVLAFLLLLPLSIGDYSKGRILATLVLAIPGAALMFQTDQVQLAIDRYVDTGIDAFGAAFRIAMLVASGLLYFILLRKPWRSRFKQDAGLASIGAWMMIGLAFVLPFSTVIGDRIGYYLIPIQAMIFARIPYLSERLGRSFIQYLPYIGLFTAFLVWTITSRHFEICYNPYQTWLFGNADLSRFGY
jgi:hypothetical protein